MVTRCTYSTGRSHLSGRAIAPSPTASSADRQTVRRLDGWYRPTVRSPSPRSPSPHLWYSCHFFHGNAIAPIRQCDRSYSDSQPIASPLLFVSLFCRLAEQDSDSAIAPASQRLTYPIQRASCPVLSKNTLAILAIAANWHTRTSPHLTVNQGGGTLQGSTTVPPLQPLP
jgi:hypothetical protein